MNVVEVVFIRARNRCIYFVLEATWRQQRSKPEGNHCERLPEGLVTTPLTVTTEECP